MNYYLENIRQAGELRRKYTWLSAEDLGYTDLIRDRILRILNISRLPSYFAGALELNLIL